MSLEIVRQVNQQHPSLLRDNINATCYQFVVLVIAALRAAGHQAFHVCKSPGEGQYTPPGFPPRDVTGLDGKTYRCSGVSHDAIWADGVIVDTIARGNDSPDPITHPDGSHMTGEPVWNLIPSEHWRQNNPPLKANGPSPAPQPVPQPSPISTLPGRDEMMAAGEWLDGYYSSAEGLQRTQGLSKNGRPDWEGVGAWLFDVYLKARIAGKNVEQARADVVSQIRRAGPEWQSKHPGETP